MSHRHAHGEPDAWEHARPARWGARGNGADRKTATALLAYPITSVSSAAALPTKSAATSTTATAGPPPARGIKGTRYSLLKDTAKQTPKQLAKLAEVVLTNKRMYRALLLLGELRYLYRLPKQEAAKRLDAWLAWASRSKLKAFVKLPRTIRKHKASVLAAIQLGISNGRLEALNSRVRLISHRAHGFHSADALIAMVYLCCAGIQIELPHR